MIRARRPEGHRILALLLTLTFMLGTGAILVAPAYQSLVPDMGPRPQMPAASALGSININLARAIGPAIAGLLIAQVGVAGVFAMNTAALLLYAIVVASHPRQGGTPESPERSFGEYDPRRMLGSSRGGTAPANPAAMVQSEAW